MPNPIINRRLIFDVEGASVPTSEISAFMKTIAPAQNIALWLLAESTGTDAVDQIDSPAQDGTYNGPTLADTTGPDGIINAPSFDGINDSVDNKSSAYEAAFNEDEFTALQWLKLPESAWTDGVHHYCFYIEDDSNNIIDMRNHSTNNRLKVLIEYSGTVKTVELNGISITDWFLMGMTVSQTLEELKMFYNGAQAGSTQTPIPAWGGGGWTDNRVRLSGTTSQSNNPWLGNIGPTSVWAKVLNAAQIEELYNLAYSTYIERGVALAPIAYWPLIGDATDEIDSPDQDGTATGVTFDANGPIAGETTAASFDGVNDDIDIKTTAFESVFDPNEFSILVWVKTNGSSGNRVIIQLTDDSNNLIKMEQDSSNNLDIVRKGAGNWKTKVVTADFRPYTTWQHLVMTVSVTNDEFIVYWNGFKVGATISSLSAWTGDKSFSFMGIGENSGAGFWSGSLAHVEIYNRPLTADEIAYRYMHTADTLTAYKDKIKDVDLPALIAQYNLISDVTNYQGDSSKDATNGGGTFTGTFENGDACIALGGAAHVDVISLETDFDEDEFTISIWAKYLGTWNDGTVRMLFSVEDDTSNNFFMRKDTDGDFRFVREGAGTTNLVDLTTPVNDANWHHYAFTVTQSGDALKAYIDGAQVGTTQTGLLAWTGAGWTSDRACIGAFRTTNANPWNGEIYGAQFYNRALTLTEIRYIYNQGVA